MSTQLTQFLPKSQSSDTKQINLSVTGMTCSSCVNSLEKSLNKIPGVRASINLAMESAHIIAPIDMKESQLIDAVKASGYGAKLFKGENESFAKSNKLGVRLFLTFIFTIPVLFLAMADSDH
jgi:Cu+-exporting ATPase